MSGLPTAGFEQSAPVAMPSAAGARDSKAKGDNAGAKSQFGALVDKMAEGAASVAKMSGQFDQQAGAPGSNGVQAVDIWQCANVRIAQRHHRRLDRAIIGRFCIDSCSAANDRHSAASACCPDAFRHRSDGRAGYGYREYRSRCPGCKYQRAGGQFVANAESCESAQKS